MSSFLFLFIYLGITAVMSPTVGQQLWANIVSGFSRICALIANLVILKIHYLSLTLTLNFSVLTTFFFNSLRPASVASANVQYVCLYTNTCFLINDYLSSACGYLNSLSVPFGSLTARWGVVNPLAFESHSAFQLQILYCVHLRALVETPKHTDALFKFFKRCKKFNCSVWMSI